MSTNKIVTTLSNFLEGARNILRNLIFVENGITFIKIRKYAGFSVDERVIEVVIPLLLPTTIDLNFFINNTTFINNYKFVFRSTFPEEVVSNLTLIPVAIKNDLAGISEKATIQNFFSFEFNVFRQLICILFSTFKIDIGGCECVPSTYSEIVLFRSGVGINCYKLSCAQAIKANPRVFDSFCSHNCQQQVCMQAILVSVLSGGNTTVNIDAKQNCETIINTSSSSSTTTTTTT